MKSFFDYIKNEAVSPFANFVARNPEFADYEGAYNNLLNKYAGDEKSVESEMKHLYSTQYGKYQLMKLSVGSPNDQDLKSTDNLNRVNWKAKNTSSPEMLKRIY